MLSYEGIHGGARYTCATIRMVSTNKECALPRILRIPRETFLPDGNFFFLSTDLAHTDLAHDVSPCGLIGEFREESLEYRVQRTAAVRLDIPFLQGLCFFFFI